MKGFIFPLQWPEPFGLVVVEALASGTPVIAFPFGSVPEIVENGKTGFIVDDVPQIVGSVKNIDSIDTLYCRKRAVEEFSISKMVDNYEKLYEKIIRLKGGEEVTQVDIRKSHPATPLELLPAAANLSNVGPDPSTSQPSVTSR